MVQLEVATLGLVPERLVVAQALHRQVEWLALV
jgi:hypothetical protein